MEENFQQLIDSFSAQSYPTTAVLEKMSKGLTKGTVPSAKQMEKLVEEIEELQKLYQKIEEITLDALPEAEHPPEGSTVEDFAKLYKKSAKSVLKKKIAHCREILELFLQVKATAPDAQTALEPVFLETREKIRSLEKVTQEEQFPSVQLEQLFLDILSFEDLFDPQVGELINEFSKIASGILVAGLFQKKYYLSSEQSPAPEIEKEEKPAECQEKLPEIASELAYYTPREPVKEKGKGNASKMKEKLMHIDKGCLSLLELVFNLQIISRNQLALIFHQLYMGDCTKSEISAEVAVTKSFEMFAKLQFVAIYELEDGDSFICFTPSANNSLRKDSVITTLRKLTKNQNMKLAQLTKEISAQNQMEKGMIDALLSENDRIIQLILSQEFAAHWLIHNIHLSSQGLCFFAKDKNLQKENMPIPVISDLSEAPEESDSVLLIADARPEDDLLENVAQQVFTVADSVFAVCIKKKWLVIHDFNPDDEEELDDELEELDDELEELDDELEELDDELEELDDELEELDDELEELDDELEELDDELEELEFSPTTSSEEKTEKISVFPEEIPMEDPFSFHDVDALAESLFKATQPVEVEYLLYLMALCLKRAEFSETIDNNDMVNTLLLAESLEAFPEFEQRTIFHNRLKAAMPLYAQEDQFTGADLADLFQQEILEVDDDSPLNSPVFQFSAYLFALFRPVFKYDTSLNVFAENFAKDSYQNKERDFFTLPQLKNFFYTLLSSQKQCAKYRGGFSERCLHRLHDKETTASKLSKLAREAVKHQKVMPHVTSMVNFIPPLRTYCFGSESRIYACLGIVAKNDTTQRDEVEAYIQEISERVDEEIYDGWNRVKERKSDKPINYEPLAKMRRAYRERLEVLNDWLEETGGEQDARNQYLNPILSQLSDLLPAVLEELETISPEENEDRFVLEQLFLYIDAELRQVSAKDLPVTKYPYASLLTTGKISLDENFLPIIHDAKFCSTWKVVISHILGEKHDLYQALHLISDNSSDIFDNFNQWKKISQYGKDIGITDLREFSCSKDNHKKAIATADEHLSILEKDMDLAYFHNQIQLQKRDDILELLKEKYATFYEIEDFSCWKNFIFSIRDELEQDKRKKQRALYASLENCRRENNLEESSMLDQVELLLRKTGDFSVAEEYLNRFQAGERSFSTESLVTDNEFLTFFHEECLTIYDYFNRSAQRRTSLQKVVRNFDHEGFPSSSQNNHRIRSQVSMLESWPAGQGENSDNIKNFFREMGFEVLRSEKDSGVDRLIMAPTTAYDHPVPALGSSMQSSVPVVCIFGNKSSAVLSTMKEHNFDELSFVLLDCALSPADRRELVADIQSDSQAMTPFLVIDRVLAYYLMKAEKSRRIPLMLKCTLPFSTYQPFSAGSGAVPKEMFYGRKAELKTLKDMNGSSLVYGGRQLGKTALLERVSEECSLPKEKKFTVMVTITTHTTEEQVVSTLVREFITRTKLKMDENIKSTEDFCLKIRNYLESGNIERLYLLVDECDNFFASISKHQYEALLPLVNLQRNSKNRVKIVLAGLHNVCRAHKALAGNSVLGQLGDPLVITPLKVYEARELLTTPLTFVGFDFEDQSHLGTILANANYYPGILQFFGYTLVQSLSSGYKEHHDVTVEPPYCLTEKMLGTVLKNSKLISEIHNKFRMTLDLDRCYLMLACSIAWNYYENGEGNHMQGVSPEQILQSANDVSIPCLQNMTSKDCTPLLDELVEMNILSKVNGEELYHFRRHTFLDMVGHTQEKLLDFIMEELESEENDE